MAQYKFFHGICLLMIKAKKEKVTFTARKTTYRPKTISFSTKKGKLVRFVASTKKTIPVKVTFYRKKNK